MMSCRNWSRSRVSKNRDQPSNLRGVIPVLLINALRQVFKTNAIVPPVPQSKRFTYAGQRPKSST
jgi:hypothetical protein